MKEISITPPATAEGFDALCRSFVAGSTIRLSPGLYWTLDGWSLKPGCCVLGSGKENTIIKQDPRRTIGGCVISGDIWHDGRNHICDLSADASFPELTMTSQESMQGVYLYGSGNSVERVRVINFGGTWSAQKEAFGICITGACTNAILRDVIGATIRDSEVSGSGTYDNGIVISPGTDKCVRGALVANCLVLDCYPRNGDGHGSACGMYSGALRELTAINCQRGYYSESVDGLTITGCQFHGCREHGILSWGEKNNRDLTIAGNLIESSRSAIHLSERGGFPMTNTKILGNTLTGSITLPATKGRGQWLLNNTLKNAQAHVIAPDAVCFGNRTPTGATIATLPDRKGKWK